MVGTMALIAFFLPALIGMINRKVNNSDTRFWVSFFVCATVGAGFNALVNGAEYAGMTPVSIADSVAESILVMIGLVKLSFEGFWDNKAIGKALPEEVIEGNKSPLQAFGLKNANSL
jgi:hypothetical protein